MTTQAAALRDAAFRKSSFSGSSGGNCVELAVVGSLFAMRDSKSIGPRPRGGSNGGKGVSDGDRLRADPLAVTLSP
jgi:hypothetical protein